MNNGEDPLLGKETATNFEVLKIRIEVAAVHASSKNFGEILQEKYPKVFNGIGKLKGQAVKLHIDQT